MCYVLVATVVRTEQVSLSDDIAHRDVHKSRCLNNREENAMKSEKRVSCSSFALRFDWIWISLFCNAMQFLIDVLEFGVGVY